MTCKKKAQRFTRKRSRSIREPLRLEPGLCAVCDARAGDSARREGRALRARLVLQRRQLAPSSTCPTFSRANSICLSPEISDRAVAAIVANVDPAVKERGVKLARPSTDACLRCLPKRPYSTRQESEDYRPVRPENYRRKNADRFEPGGEEGAAPVTGSSLYLYEQLDLIDAIPWILKSGVQELRFEFTNERFADVEAILARQNASASSSIRPIRTGLRATAPSDKPRWRRSFRGVDARRRASAVLFPVAQQIQLSLVPTTSPHSTAKRPCRARPKGLPSLGRAEEDLRFAVGITRYRRPIRNTPGSA